MGKVKKRVAIVSALLCTFLFSQVPYTYDVYAAENLKTNAEETQKIDANTGLKDNFYNTVNDNWLKNTQISTGRVSNSSFDQGFDNITKQMTVIIKDLLSHEKDYSENSDEKKVINLYKNILNMEERNKQGTAPVKELINEVNNLNSVKDVSNINIDSKINNSLINFTCTPDIKDSSKHVLNITNSSLSLGDSDEYTKPTEKTKYTKGLVEKYYMDILKLSGYSEDAAKAKIDNCFKFENMIAPYITGAQESAKDVNLAQKQYNVYTLDELDKLAPNLNIKTILKNYNIDNANKIIVKQPKWLEGLNKLYTEENLPLIKDYLEIKNIDTMSTFLGKDFVDAVTEFNNKYTGSIGAIEPEEGAVISVNSVLSEIMARLYVERYSSDKVKKDVTSLVQELLDTYRNRIQNLDWMSTETKEKAIEKIDKMEILVAYPDKWEDYSGLEIRSFEEGGSLVENMRNIRKFMFKQLMSDINESVDKTEFSCSPQTVNAYYNPSKNSITVPAGILQDGFYNINDSKEKKLGGIGTVIGHELSHAFDTNGSQYDADGNLNNWWTEEDYNKFKEKTDKVRAYYNTLKTSKGLSVDGDLTISENISDLGGVAVTLDIMNKMENPNYKDFFESQAKVWREKRTDEYAELLIKYDLHSPGEIRTNAVLPQFEEFYKTYDIKPGDKMYVKPEDRLKVW